MIAVCQAFQRFLCIEDLDIDQRKAITTMGIRKIKKFVFIAIVHQLLEIQRERTKII